MEVKCSQNWNSLKKIIDPWHAKVPKLKMTDLFQTLISGIWNSKKIFKLCPQVSMWVGEVRASSIFVRENIETEEEKKKNDGKGQD